MVRYAVLGGKNDFTVYFFFFFKHFLTFEPTFRFCFNKFWLFLIISILFLSDFLQMFQIKYRILCFLNKL